jgi:hypothetical protein
VLVQSDTPLTEEQKTQLSGLGIAIQEYVSENTYLCGYKPTDLSAVRALPRRAGKFFIAFTIIVGSFEGRWLRRRPTLLPAVLTAW